MLCIQLCTYIYIYYVVFIELNISHTQGGYQLLCTEVLVLLCTHCVAAMMLAALVAVLLQANTDTSDDESYRATAPEAILTFCW